MLQYKSPISHSVGIKFGEPMSIPITGGFTEEMLVLSGAYMKNQFKIYSDMLRRCQHSIYIDDNRIYKYQSLLDYALCQHLPMFKALCIAYYKSPDDAESFAFYLQDALLRGIDVSLLRALKSKVPLRRVS